jgi:hypothetical protein
MIRTIIAAIASLRQQLAISRTLQLHNNIVDNFVTLLYNKKIRPSGRLHRSLKTSN